MESGGRLASSPGPPAQAQTPSDGGAPPGDPPCGPLFQMADQPFSLSGGSGAFPLLGHPAFGLFAATGGSGRSEFGGLGTLGVSAALGAHPQLGAFPDWWRASEPRDLSVLFHPLLGLPPLFPPPFHNHHAFQLGPAPNGRSAAAAAAKGTRRAVIGGAVRSPPAGNGAPHRAPVQRAPSLEKSRATRSSPGAPEQQSPQREQALNPSPPECGSQSASSSESSSDDGASSSELDDEDDEEEDEELSSDSDDSEDARGKLKPPAQGPTPERKRKRVSEGEEARGRKRSSSSYHPQSSSLATSALRPRTRGEQEEQEEEEEEEEATQHTSVIQTTGLAAGHQPPAMVPAPHRETSAGPPPSHCSSPMHLALSSSPSSPSHPSSPTPPSVPSSPVPPSPASPSHRDRALTQLTQPPRAGSRACPRDASLQASTLQQPFLPQDSFRRAPPGSHRGLRRRPSSPPPSPWSHTNLFLSALTNGALPPPQDAQHAPLALTTRPRAPEPLPLPVNLCTGARRPALTSSRAPTSSAAAHRPTRGGRSVPSDTALRSTASDITSSKDSEDSLEEEEEDEEDDDEEDGSLSESDSNLESDSDGSEDDPKERGGPEADAERPPPKLSHSLFCPSSSSSCLSSSISPLNLQLIKPHDRLPRGQEGPTTGPPAGARTYSTPPSSSTSSTAPGTGRRRRVTDEQVLRVPLQFGWQRETRIRALGGRLQGEVSYYAPCGKKLRQYPDVMKYLSRNGITQITRDNFSFSTKIRVGDFYQGREGPQGSQWFLLGEEQVAPCIVAMDGRRSRQGPGPPPRHGDNDIQDASGLKLLRKLEAQEIARQATQIKVMRKLEKQAVARAAKEARRQQAVLAGEERRKRKEQMKIQKQQEKMQRVQQIRVEKEMRAQHILEERRNRKAEAANAKVEEAERRSKEKEVRRQQAVVLKHQELERHRLDMERERRRQHLMLMKALEARKKVEERERVKQEKKDEKRLNKERRLELKRLELERAKDLKRPNEDMCLTDHKSLPELSRLPGLLPPGASPSDLLMVVQFLHSFSGVLGLDGPPPSLHLLREGLLNRGPGAARLSALLVSLLAAAVRDPGLPAGHRTKTLLGEPLSSVRLTGDSVSEALQMFLEAHGEQPELALRLRTTPFRALHPAHKAALLAVLVNELCCSKAVVREIDRTIDSMTGLRKDKWCIEGRLRKLRSAHARQTGRKEGEGPAAGEGEGPAAGGLAAGPRPRRREGDSEEEEEEDDSEDQGDDEEEDEEEESGVGGGGGRKGRRLCEEEDVSLQTASVEELEKQIEKLSKQQSQIRRKLFDSSHSLRSTPYGQDRYRRRYWLLAPCGGLLLEAPGPTDGCVQLNEEGERGSSPRGLKVTEEETAVSPTPPDLLQAPPPQNLFLLKPSSFSTLSTLLEAGAPPGVPSEPGTRAAPVGPPPGVPLDPGSPPPPPGVPAEQLLRALTERGAQWFSLLPRSACDDASVTSSSPRDASPPCLSPQPPALTDPPGASSLQLSALQGAGAYAGLPFFPPFGPLPPLLALAYQQQYEVGGTSNPFLVHAPPAQTSNLTPPKPPATPAPETTRTLDYPEPKPIPEDMARGWWRVRGVEELQGVVAALHSRGVRERSLQKQIQKNMEYLSLAWTGTSEEAWPLEEQPPGGGEWCVEDQAMEVDLGLLQQVENLERKVFSGGLQVKIVVKMMDVVQQSYCRTSQFVVERCYWEGWRPPAVQSERGDLVYHEHRGGVARRSDNPLDIAVLRLGELENHIERSGEEEAAPGMRLWGRALAEVRSSAQLSLCIQQLQKSLTWERVIMKACCQLCGRGDREELLLLCDGCDRGLHTYCLRPRITAIPQGDWFCPACLPQGSTLTPQEQSPAGNVGTAEAGETGVTGGSGPSRPRRGAATAGEVSEDEAPSPASSSISSSTSVSISSSNSVSSSSSARSGRKESRKRRAEEGGSAGSQQESPAPWGRKGRTANDNKDNGTTDLSACRGLLGELEAHQDAWPFLLPVDQRSVPGYRKVIRRPMDLSTIRGKISSNQYPGPEAFLSDLALVLDNCERFNKDRSEIGRAGLRLRSFLERRCAQLLQQSP